MYKNLKKRLDKGATVILDGAVGTRLQVMGVPMNNIAWAATALQTHPDTVRLMHRQYIDAGAEIITTNTYSSAHHNLEPLGMGDLTGELNRRAVRLAEEARDAAGVDVSIAGSISNFGITVEGEPREALHRYARPRTQITAAQARANLHQQADLLAEAGVDLLLLESTGGMVHRQWLAEACLATGLPVWLGFKCRLQDGEVRVGYSSPDTLAAGLAEMDLKRFDAVTVFHSSVDATSAALGVVRQHWEGVLALYPEAERHDYTAEHHDESVATMINPTQFADTACEWIHDGARVVGGCCGIDLRYIAALRAAVKSAKFA